MLTSALVSAPWDSPTIDRKRRTDIRGVYQLWARPPPPLYCASPRWAGLCVQRPHVGSNPNVIVRL